MLCDAILFDLDGVLVDSAACVERHWGQWAVKHGLDVERVLRLAHGRRTVEAIAMVAPHLHAESEAAELTHNEESDTSGVFEVHGARELLESLRSEAWAVATSGSTQTALTRILHTGLPVPRVLISADDVSRGKPHPEPYLCAADRIEVSAARCVVVEDTPAGVAAAQAADMRVIAIVSTHRRDEFGARRCSRRSSARPRGWQHPWCKESSDGNRRSEGLVTCARRCSPKET
jgi:sugar-phosphatase